MTNGVRAAPLWDSKKQSFVGKQCFWNTVLLASYAGHGKKLWAMLRALVLASRHADHHWFHQYPAPLLQIRLGKDHRLMTKTTFPASAPHSHFLPSKPQGVYGAGRSSLKFCCFCFQVQIYELEEHKIETWRGMQRIGKGAGWEDKEVDLFLGNGFPWWYFVNPFFLSEVYLQDSFKPLVCISPNARWVPATHLYRRGRAVPSA